MERNLIKYDLKKMFKLLTLFYVIAIILTTITRIFSIFDYMLIFNIFKYIFSALSYAVWSHIFVQTFVQIILRFTSNFYGYESYLTHTLPVSKNQLLLSKFISSIVVTFTTIIVLLCCVFIMFFSPDNMQIISTFITSSLNDLQLSPALFIILIVAIFFVEICAIISMCFAGIIIGKQFNNNKNIKSLLIISGFYLSSIIITFILAIVLFAIMGQLSSLFNNAISGSNILAILILGLVLYIAFTIIFYFVSKKQFEKGVNVD